MSTIQTIDNTTTGRRGRVAGLLLGGAAVLVLAACGDPATADQGPTPAPDAGVSQEWLAGRTAQEQRAVPLTAGVSQEWLAGRTAQEQRAVPLTAGVSQEWLAGQNAQTTCSVPLTAGVSQEWKASRETFGD